MGKKGLRTREAFLDATEAIMVSEGYAAVTTRKVASKLGVTPGGVHYYFPTTDDLLLATYRRAAERRAERIRVTLESPTPLRALWRIYTNSTEVALNVELAAMAIHRRQIRDEMAHNIEAVRKLQENVFAAILNKYAAATWFPPECASLILSAVARTFVQERSLGVTYGTESLPELIETLIEHFEPETAESASASKQSNQRKPVSPRHKDA